MEKTKQILKYIHFYLFAATAIRIGKKIVVKNIQIINVTTIMLRQLEDASSLGQQSWQQAKSKRRATSSEYAACSLQKTLPQPLVVKRLKLHFLIL